MIDSFLMQIAAEALEVGAEQDHVRVVDLPRGEPAAATRASDGGVG